MIRKDGAARYGLFGLGLIVAAFVIWAFILPSLNDKTSNERLDDIVSAPVRPQGPPPRGVSEPMMPAAPPAAPIAPTVIRSGDFAPLRDKSAGGKASIVKSGDTAYLRLEDGFNVTNGPDLYVAFGNGGAVDESTLFAKLKANSGGQNYELPASLDHTRYKEVFIHCKAFSYSFAVAKLSE
jgi:hypothetical protein